LPVLWQENKGGEIKMNEKEEDIATLVKNILVE
jgi:hypothetical protein